MVTMSTLAADIAIRYTLGFEPVLGYRTTKLEFVIVAETAIADLVFSCRVLFLAFVGVVRSRFFALGAAFSLCTILFWSLESTLMVLRQLTFRVSCRFIADFADVGTHLE